jgi:hypothetical protein
VTLAFIDER